MSAQSTLDLKALKANKNVAARTYWRNRLADFEFGSYFNNNTVSPDGNEYAVYSLKSPENIAEILEGIAPSDKAKHIVLLAALVILVQKYSSVTDVAIFTPVYADQQDSDGHFIPVRMDTFQGLGFKEFLTAVKNDLIKDLAHSDYPLHKIVSMGREELRETPVTAMLLENIQQASFDDVMPDILFSFSQTNGLSLEVKYNAGKFNTASVAQIATLYFDLLHKLLSNKEEDISRLSLLLPQEEFRLLHTFNNTEHQCPANETVITLFVKQAALTPNNIALKSGEQIFTYEQLDQLSDKIAAYLQQQKGVKTGDLVGILLEREQYLLPCILGVLKTGAAYVPLDPAYPFERVRSIVQDSEIKLLIGRDNAAWQLQQDMLGRIVNLDEELEAIQNTQAAFSPVQPGGNSLAYVIYTSGSTGMPKGVMINHGSLLNYINWAAQQYTKGEKAGFALYTSISFDLTITSIFVPLITGNTVFSYNDDEASLLIEQVIAADEAAVIKLTPAHLRIIRDSETVSHKTLKRFIVGGEQLQTQLALDIYEKFNGQVEIYNEYGPTEATVGCMIYQFNPNDLHAAVPIGVPIHNTKIYLLDTFLQPVPAGVQGEMYISGEGVAMGYLHREDLTAEKFIDNPFIQGRKMYRTGDVAVRLDNGNILYQGRVDDQVKIRGYRIEPGEIENQLKMHRQVTEAAVVAKDRQGDKYLAAYYTASQRMETQELQEFLAEKLPAYMIPQYFIYLDSIPLTANGKLNRKALPDVDIQAGNNYVAPSTPLEKLLVDVWQDVLGVENIGVTDDFFSLGGDSIKSIQIASRAQNAGYEISVVDIFDCKTVQGLALKLQGQSEEQTSAQKTSFNIPNVEVQPYYPLSAAQSRLWVLSQFEQSKIAFNQPSVFVFEGNLDRAALEYAFGKVIERHESLRTVFREDDRGEIKQHILAPETSGFQLKYQDLRQSPQKEEAANALVRSALATPFDLVTGPLLRAELFQVENNKWLMAYVTHHIISDGWSMNVLINDLLLFYNARIKGEEYQPQPLRIQYKDYTAWQNEQLSGESLMKYKDYWIKQFQGELPVLMLPTDKNRPAIRTYNGGLVVKVIDASTAKAFKAVSQEQGSTLFMALLAAVNVLLYKYTGQQDIIIGSPIAGRENIDLENQIGFYINTLALRTRFKGENSFKEILQRVKEVTLGAYEHQVYPFDELVGQVNVNNDTSRNALFDVMVVLQNAELSSSKTPQSLGDLRITDYEGARNIISSFDMTFDFAEVGNEVILSIEYNSDLFHKSTAVRMAEQFEQLLQAIVKQPSTPVDKLEYMTAAEKQQAEQKQKLINDLDL
jgi:amino acid adenylation domain-containing protein